MSEISRILRISRDLAHVIELCVLTSVYNRYNLYIEKKVSTISLYLLKSLRIFKEY